MNHLNRGAYAEFTSDRDRDGNDATANSVVSLGAITYEAVPHMIESSRRRRRPTTVGGCSRLTVGRRHRPRQLGKEATISRPARFSPFHLPMQDHATAATHLQREGVGRVGGLWQHFAGGWRNR